MVSHEEDGGGEIELNKRLLFFIHFLHKRQPVFTVLEKKFSILKKESW